MHNPCTPVSRPVLPARVRAAAKLAAFDAALAAHSSSYCGPVTKTLRWGAAGSLRSVTAQPEAELFAASCDMPVAFSAPQRFVRESVIAAAVNTCE